MTGNQSDPPVTLFNQMADGAVNSLNIVCQNSIGSLPWAIPYGEQEIRVMRRQAAEILNWYDHFRTVIPNWYHKEEKS